MTTAMHAISNTQFEQAVELIQAYIADNSAKRDLRTVNKVRRARLLLRAFDKNTAYKKK
jgi:hypothetical protein